MKKVKASVTLTILLLVLVIGYFLVMRTSQHTALMPRINQTTQSDKQTTQIIEYVFNKKKLPAQANAVSETYQNWQVNCVADDNQGCTITTHQTQSPNDLTFALNNQQQLVAQVIAPLGIDLRKGVDSTIAMQGKIASQHSEYLTCSDQGCTFELVLPIAVIKQFQKAYNIKINYYTIGQSNPNAMTIPLAGFNSTLSRLLYFYQK
ncbi:hypothetical protein DMW62_01740 [Serratia marcescens]|uniref:Invasion associated locus B family protein n=1 Tax=Serratia marcescens TaxID=615 RepID=A0ABX5NNN5_SERMA|nr:MULTISPECIES: invasion associated locus B family protein [Serratia]MDI9110327.1 invasion associated locus B family protein [Serratia marcescens]MDR8536434.1 invasion associated locus B family protein [Serratia nevei]PXZ92260.1 hypothetical protein CW300_22160 [Serratia marcescens]PYA12869.1 hypothetical protein DMW42_19710 [Serratia marcescens]PYA20871.1 hypothetical protein DMW41_21550 [Serratia marcescens]